MIYKDIQHYFIKLLKKKIKYMILYLKHFLKKKIGIKCLMDFDLKVHGIVYGHGQNQEYNFLNY